MKRIVFLSLALFLLYSFDCNAALNLQLSVHWQSPLTAPQDVTMNQMMFSPHGYGGSGNKLNDNDGNYYTSQHILGSYWATNTSRAYFSRPKKSSFVAGYGPTLPISSAQARRSAITGWAQGCKVFGPGDATSAEGVFCYDWINGNRRTNVSDNKNIFGALRGKMELSLANFNPLPGVTTMNTSDYFPGGVYVPLHFVTPGTYVVATKYDWRAASSVNKDLNGVIAQQNNYAAMYSDGTSTESSAVKASDDIGF